MFGFGSAPTRAVAAGLFVLVSGCGSVDSTGNASSASSSALSIVVSSGDLVPAFDPSVHDYALSSFTTLRAVTMTVEGATKATAFDTAFEDGVAHALPSLAIDAETTIPVTITRGGASSVYTIHVLPSDFPALQVTANNPSDGQIFIAPFSWDLTASPWALVLSSTGTVLQYTRMPSSVLLTDFKKQIVPESGAVRYSYIYEDDAHVFDEQFQPIETHRVVATSGHAAEAIDVHEFEYLGPDHYVLMSEVPVNATNIPSSVNHVNGALVTANRIQEVENGNVIFEWLSTDHPELYALATEGNDFTSTTVAADYVHGNSVDVDPVTGNLVASFRHLDAVLELSRTDGSIVWRLGNVDDSFGTTPTQRSSHQHFARFLPDGRLRMFDNGNASGASRALTFGLDAANGTVTSFASVPLGYYAYAMGSVMAVGTSSLFVGLGYHPDASAPDAFEIDASGNHTFELHLPSNFYSYRAFKM